MQEEVQDKQRDMVWDEPQVQDQPQDRTLMREKLPRPQDHVQAQMTTQEQRPPQQA